MPKRRTLMQAAAAAAVTAAAGPARAESEDGYLSKGSTGVTVRTLLTWLGRRGRR